MARKSKQTAPQTDQTEPETGFSDEPEAMAADFDPMPDAGAEHLDSFRAPDLDIGDDGGGVIMVDEEGAPIDDGPPAQLDKDQFWTVFKTAFDLPGMMIEAFKPLGIQEGEQSNARAASDAIHELLSIYYPRALSPMGDTFALLLASAPFFIGKAIIVREIIANAKQKPKQSKPNQESEQQTPQPQKGVHSPMSWLDNEAA